MRTKLLRGCCLVVLSAMLAGTLAIAREQEQEEEAPTPAPTPAPANPAAAGPDKKSRLQGSAYLDRNNDVPGATVIVSPSNDAGVLYVTSTNAQGRFKVDGLPDGEYRVRVERHGVKPITKEAVQVKFPFRAVIDLDMEPAADGQPGKPGAAAEPGGSAAGAPVHLSGTVRDQDAAPLADAGLRLVHAGATVDPILVTSDEDGKFSVSDVPTGTWQLTILGVGTLPIRTSVTLAKDTDLEALLVRQPASYLPSPIDLMPPEQPIPPAALGPLRLGGA
jgi:hypothetical protein